MGEITVQVPAEYADDFRIALVEEIAFDIQGLQDDRKEHEERIAQQREDAGKVDEDHRDHMKQLQRDAALVDQVGLDLGAGAIDFRPEGTTYNLDTIAQAFERIARDVVGPRLADALCVGPIDRDWLVNHLRPVLEELEWALDRAATFHDLYWECKEGEEAA